MTITATPATGQIEAIESELELLGMAWQSIEALTPDQLQDVWANFTQVSPEDRAAYAAYVSAYVGTDLTSVTDQTTTNFRDVYVGAFTTSTDFVRSYARARWFNPMASADAYAAFTTDLESVLDWIDYDRLTEALFHEMRHPYTFVLGLGADYIFATPEPQPAQPRISF